MSGGCDRQRSDEDEIIEAHDVRLRRERDEALLKASKAFAALVAAREDLETARADRDEARLDVERRAQDARDAAGRAGVAYAHLESILRGEREAHVRTRADRGAAERRIQLAVVAFDALRDALRLGELPGPFLDALERALRGVVEIQAPNQAGPWIEVAAGEWRRIDERKSLLFAASISERNDRVLEWSAYPPDFDPPTVSAARDTALDLQAAKDACDAALVRAGWELASVKAGSIEDRLTAVEARIAKLEGGAPQPVIEAPGYVPASGCAECGNDPGALHGVDCSRSNESRARR